MTAQAHEHPRRATGPRLAALSLLVGNLVIGLSILGPAGMIDPLASDLGVSVTRAAFLITGGAVVLCIGSPLVAAATATMDRKLLLAGAMSLLALCHAASAIAGDYTLLLAIRLAAMLVAAVFTPQAASAIGMIVGERERPGAIAFVFLGWSLAAALGLPAVAWVSAEVGWRSVHWGLAALSLLAAAMVVASLPSGLSNARMSFASWNALLRDRLVLMLLAATALASTGQFVVITYVGPLLARMADADAAQIVACFAAFGIAGFLGNVAATRIVGRAGAFITSMIFFGLMVIGASIWSLGAGIVVFMTAGAGIWGLGFAASNSMQQARLAAAAPSFSGAAIALNSSAIYVGQAAGSATGGALFDRGFFHLMGWTTVALLALTLLVVAMTRPTASRV
ncbi:MAG: MFS transporter [Rhizobiaceae bacterium]|nr:MFS transporter [Rhizobiaceae bacterium]MCV0405082.1 MFS transporter [Rhizobiaceae bacterium]